MTLHSENHEEIRLYLLGSLTEEVQQRIEKRLLTEGDFLDELEVCEAELIDDYVNDELDAYNRARFEKHFLCSPDRIQKLKFAMALGRYTSQLSESGATEPPNEQVKEGSGDLSWSERFSSLWNAHTWAFRSAMTFAVIAIIAVVVWLSLPPTPKTFVALTLSISTTDRAQGAPATRVKLPLNADALRIILKLPNSSAPAPKYRIELVDVNGLTKRVEVEGLDTQSVSVVIPETQLARGEYALKLFMMKADGTEQRINGSYLFTVE